MKGEQAAEAKSMPDKLRLCRMGIKPEVYGVRFDHGLGGGPLWCLSKEKADSLVRAVNGYEAQREVREVLSDLVEDIEQWGLMDGEPWPALDRATRILARVEAAEAPEVGRE